MAISIKRAPLRGVLGLPYRGYDIDIGIDVDVDVDMDIDSEMTVSILGVMGLL